MTFATQLKMLRNLRGLTQVELAEKTGIPNTYLSLMETGKLLPAGEYEQALKRELNWPEESAFAALLNQAAAVAEPLPA